MDDRYVCNTLSALGYFTCTRNWKNRPGFMCLFVFIKVQRISLVIFFNNFYLYTLCTFYYLCKLCLYDLFSSSVFFGVNELAFMLYLLFVFFSFAMLLIFGSEPNLQYEYSPPVKFTLAL